jgi:pyruvate/2-oxoacid:ferredoxin oxidoreductase beta subunit
LHTPGSHRRFPRTLIAELSDHICYDNEAYMNTGIQKSSFTPFGARTTTTPAGKRIRGSQTRTKNMFEIVAAHGIEYTSTTSVGYIQDLLNKVNKVKSVGWDFLHLCVCALPDRMGGPFRQCH